MYKCEMCNKEKAEIYVDYDNLISNFYYKGYTCFECVDKIERKIYNEVK